MAPLPPRAAAYSLRSIVKLIGAFAIFVAAIAISGVISFRGDEISFAAIGFSSAGGAAR